MKHRLIGVLGAALFATAAVVAAQTTAPRPAAPRAPAVPQDTYTGCVEKGSTGAYILADAVDAKAGSGAKKSFMLTGVVPGLKLADFMKKRVEVVGSVGEPTSVDPGRPALIMQSVKAATGSCS